MGTDYRNLKYKVLSIRLSDEVIAELKKRRQEFKSWNLLFRELLETKNGENNKKRI